MAKKKREERFHRDALLRFHSSRNASRTIQKIRRSLFGLSLLAVFAGAVLLANLSTPLPKPPIDAIPRAHETPVPGNFRDLQWDDLMPRGWDPYKRFKDKKVDRINDSDARAEALLSEMREAWDEAPTVPALEGVAVRIPGYLVPLDEDHGRLSEFLLVPYFGACIHTPPPPANQIIHVRLKTPVEGYKTMDTVWVAGSIHQAHQESFMGTSGYGLSADRVERYVAVGR